MKFTISIPRESCTNAKAKYSSSVVPPDPSVHFYHCEDVNELTNLCFKLNNVCNITFEDFNTRL